MNYSGIFLFIFTSHFATHSFRPFAVVPPNLLRVTQVWWAVVAGVTQATDDLSCAREGRAFQPLVPCDLGTDAFCDTSGDTYPW